MHEVTPALLERVKSEAFYIGRKLPASVEIQDLVQMGMIGLMKAQESYVPEQGASFETYASHKIRWAIQDGLRQQDWMGRADRGFIRKQETLRARMEQTAGGLVTETDVATEMGIPLHEFQKRIGVVGIEVMPLLEDYEESPGGFELPAAGGNPEEDALKQEMSDKLTEAIEKLPPRERLVLRLRYEKDLLLHEIGTFMGVTESRACQLHTKAVSRLRKMLT